MIKNSLKNRLYLGLGILSLLIIMLWITGTYFVYDLSSRSEAMLHENYQSVESSKYLTQSLDELKNMQTVFFFGNRESFSDTLYNSTHANFLTYLEAIENNITEPGEYELIEILKSSYSSYNNLFKTCLSHDSSPTSQIYFDQILPSAREVRNNIVRVSEMNMTAIRYKQNMLRSNAYRAFIIMSLIGTISFLIAAMFILRFPKTILDPVNDLMSGAREISNRNYSYQTVIRNDDELGELARAFNIMSLRLNEFEHSNFSRILFEKKRIDTIINSMTDGIIGLNQDMEIIFSNTHACNLLDIPPEKLVGLSAIKLATSNALVQKIMSDLNPEDIKSGEAMPIKINKSGRNYYYSREFLKVEDIDAGEVTTMHAGFVIILKNITHFLELDQAKTNFISTISHELKTPLSSIRLNLKLMDDDRIGSLNSEQRDIVKVLKSESARMLAITTELLDMAQVESGNIMLDIQSVSPTSIIDYVRESINNHAGPLGVGVDFVIPKDLPQVEADITKSAWVLLNMANNALRYSNTGGSVTISATHVKDEVIFKVEDAGKGIEGKYLEKIFDKYFKVPGSSEDGSGLGLSISKEFILRQNGRIWAESYPGKGSRFYFSLPVVIRVLS